MSESKPKKKGTDVQVIYKNLDNGYLYEVVGFQGLYTLVRRFGHLEEFGREAPVHKIPPEKMDEWEEIKVQ